VSAAPYPSATINVTVFCPPELYEWLGDALVDVPPSPNVHELLEMPWSSVDVFVNVTD
jgi:hypothetical protein